MKFVNVMLRMLESTAVSLLFYIIFSFLLKVAEQYTELPATIDYEYHIRLVVFLIFFISITGHAISHYSQKPLAGFSNQIPLQQAQPKTEQTEKELPEIVPPKMTVDEILAQLEETAQKRRVK